MKLLVPVFEELLNCRLRFAGEIEIEAEPRPRASKPPKKETLRIPLNLETRLVG